MYGHSVFETVAVNAGKLLLWDQHLARLLLGAQTLNIPFHNELATLLMADVAQLLASHEQANGLNVIRIQLTMGQGGRGYANPESPTPTRIVSLHDYPIQHLQRAKTGVNIGVSDVRLAQQPLLAGIKHGNRLEQVLARSRWHPDWDEALLLDQDQNVIEGTQSNLFVVEQGVLKTPDLSLCGVAGVMRGYVLGLAQTIGVEVQTVRLSLSQVESADEVFLTNSLIGIWPVKRCGKILYNTSEVSSKLLKKIQKNEVIPNI